MLLKTEPYITQNGRWPNRRLRILFATLFLILSIPTALSISELYASHQASLLKQHGATVDYGVKGGYFVTPHQTTDLPKFFEDGGPSLNYLSTQYPLTIRLDGRDLSGVDLSGLKQITGTFYLSMRNAKIDETQFEQLIAMPNLRGVDAANTLIADSLLAKFNQTRSP